MCGVLGCGGVGFGAVVCGGVMFGAVGCGAVVPPKKSTMKFVSKPRNMQHPHTPKAPPPRKSPPPGVREMVRANKYACPVVCVVVRCALFFTLIFGSMPSSGTLVHLPGCAGIVLEWNS